MLAAAIAWIGIGTFSFASSTDTWDIYRVVGALSVAMILVCILAGKNQSDKREEAKQKLIIKVEPVKTYGERYAEWEKKSGARTKAERDATIGARAEKNLARRLRE
jgi:hypothetical protein